MADKATFTWDVFFKGKEGYAEHIQVGSENAEDLQAGRGGLMLWLQAIEAETLPRDKENQGKSYPPRTGAPAPVGNNPNRGVAPVCPEDGAPMALKSGVKGPNTAAPGQPYSFYGCTNYPKCRGTARA